VPHLITGITSLDNCYFKCIDPVFSLESLLREFQPFSNFIIWSLNAEPDLIEKLRKDFTILIHTGLSSI